MGINMMTTMLKIGLAATASLLAFGSIPANAVTVVDGNCVSVADLAGCLFDGNIAPGTVLETQNAYNTYNDTNPSAQPDIVLNFLTKSDDGNFSAFGSITGEGASSGTWSLPGYLVDYIAVKASNQFVLYATGGASSGSWNTFNIPFVNNPHEMSHLAFFGSVVPEPATWGMMILGIGFVGSVLRRRQRQSVSFRFA